MAAAAAREQPDMILHLGDGFRDCAALRQRVPSVPITALAGNCDRGADAPEQFCDEVEGVKIFACHGHRYGVKTTLLHLFYAAQEQAATLCLYGHTHIARCEVLRGMQFLNPGPCSGLRPGYGIIEIENGHAVCRTARL